MNEHQIALAKRALATLRLKPDFCHNASYLAMCLGPEVAASIRHVTEEYKNYNKLLTLNPAGLASDTLSYWNECKKMLAYGRLALSKGNLGSEKRLSLMCERVEESFELLVTASDRGKFIIHDADAGIWDERWHSCRDWFPPLLREEFTNRLAVDNAGRKAQLEVLTRLVEPPPPLQSAKTSTEHSSARLRQLIRRE